MAVQGRVERSVMEQFHLPTVSALCLLLAGIFARRKCRKLLKRLFSKVYINLTPEELRITVKFK